VRHEAARRLVGEPASHMTSKQKERFREILSDYEMSLYYSSDFAVGRFNLANLFMAQGKLNTAEKNYLAALSIDSLFYPAKINLAMLYNQTGRNNDAEALFKEVLTKNPDFHEISYSLGLLLAEMEKYEEAAEHLENAARGLPDRARVQYNLGRLLQHLGREDAATRLGNALDIEPDNIDFLYTLADYYLKGGQLEKARDMAGQMRLKHPNNPLTTRLANDIRRAMADKTNI
jgi:tetratricopeptide (TPR) repeat protein